MARSRKSKRPTGKGRQRLPSPRASAASKLRRRTARRGRRRALDPVGFKNSVRPPDSADLQQDQVNEPCAVSSTEFYARARLAEALEGARACLGMRISACAPHPSRNSSESTLAQATLCLLDLCPAEIGGLSAGHEELVHSVDHAARCRHLEPVELLRSRRASVSAERPRSRRLDGQAGAAAWVAFKARVAP
jgi:hypothetical protein